MQGATKDLANVEDAVGIQLYNSIKDLRMTKSTAIGHIKRFLDYCRENNYNSVIFYTGHGEVGTGNWCFADGKISMDDIDHIYYEEFDCDPRDNELMIVSDACYSGSWANLC